MVVKPGRPVYGTQPVERQMMPSNVVNVPLRKGPPPPTAAATAATKTYRPLHSTAPHPVRAREAVGTFQQRNSFKQIPTQPPPTRISSIRALQDNKYALKKEAQNELECNYDTSATELYELLESSDWERARSRSRTHPDEVSTWIVRKDKNQQVRWRLLPLHAAIIFQSPSFLVSSLLERYPAAASRKDDQGMLPLHLAFRHKQDDEDLLELLLAQYPEAVTMRDRRERVPLDHGRESRFSSKLMRLYAEAILTSSAQNGTSKHQAGSLGTTTTRTANSDSLTHNTHTLAHSQLARLEAEHEAKVAVVKADYEYQMKTLSGKYEDRLHILQEKGNAILRQTQADAESDRQKLIEMHEDELNQLRDILTRQVNEDRATAEALQEQVNILQNSLHEAKDQTESLEEKYRQTVSDTDELRDFLDRLYAEQDTIQDLIGKQQEYLRAARTIRTELVQTLLKQEDQDSENDRLKGTKLIDIATQVQRRITQFVERRFDREVDREFLTEAPRETAGEPEIAKVLSGGDRRGPSRIDVERAEGDRIYADHQGHTEAQTFYVVPGEDARAPQQQEAYVKEKVPAVKEEDYGEVRILADEISAITENSAY